MMAEHLGVTRSRTLLFLSYRDSAARDTSRGPLQEGERRTGAYFDASGELHEEQQASTSTLAATASTATLSSSSRLPPRWVDVSDEVDSILASLPARMEQLDRLHARHILPGFADRSSEEREIERETTGITKQFRRCSKLIAGLAEHTRHLSRSGQATMREVAMANNVQTALATKVQDASGTFRRKQSNYMQRLRGHEERHHDLKLQTKYVPDSETAMREDVELSRQHLATSRSNQLQEQVLRDEEDVALAEDTIAERDRQVDQIARSIAELADLFQDLSGLVIDQGTMLDRIDFNIEHMGEDMSAAVREIDEATRYQKRTSRGQCILFLFLLILLCLAIIIVKPFWRLFFVDSPVPPLRRP